MNNRTMSRYTRRKSTSAEVRSAGQMLCTSSGTPQAGLAPLARVVFVAGQFAVPGQQRRGRHGEDVGPAPAREEPCQRGEPHPVARLIPYPAGVPAQHRVLVPEHEQLSSLRPVAAEHQDSQAEYPARQQVDDLEQHPASQPSLRSSCWEQCRSTTQTSIRAAQVRDQAQRAPNRRQP